MKKIRHLATVTAMTLATSLTFAGTASFAQSSKKADNNIAASTLSGLWLLELDTSIPAPKTNSSATGTVSNIPNTKTASDPYGTALTYNIDIKTRGNKISRCSATAAQSHLPPISTSCEIKKDKLEIKISESGAGVVTASLSQVGASNVFAGEAEMEHPSYPIKLPAGKMKLSPAKAGN